MPQTLRYLRKKSINLNEHKIIGRVTRDPEMRTTQTGQIVATFSVATNNTGYSEQGLEEISITKDHPCPFHDFNHSSSIACPPPTSCTCERIDELVRDGRVTVRDATARDERNWSYEQLVNLDGEARIVARMAFEYGWKMLWHREEEGRIRFKKNKKDIVDVWYGTMTVGTIIDHPKRGRNQLFRKSQTMKELRMIFENPRVHTGEGYHHR